MPGLRSLLPAAARGLVILGLIGLLGGCVVYPAYPTSPAYGYYYDAPAYGGPYVGFGGGWHDGGWRR